LTVISRQGGRVDPLDCVGGRAADVVLHLVRLDELPKRGDGASSRGADLAQCPGGVVAPVEVAELFDEHADGGVRAPGDQPQRPGPRDARRQRPLGQGLLQRRDGRLGRRPELPEGDRCVFAHRLQRVLECRDERPEGFLADLGPDAAQGLRRVATHGRRTLFEQPDQDRHGRLRPRPDVSQGPTGPVLRVKMLVIQRFDQRRDRRLRLRPDPHQPVDARAAGKGVVLLYQRDQRLDGLLGLRADPVDGIGSAGEHLRVLVLQSRDQVGEGGRADVAQGVADRDPHGHLGGQLALGPQKIPLVLQRLEKRRNRRFGGRADRAGRPGGPGSDVRIVVAECLDERRNRALRLGTELPDGPSGFEPDSGVGVLERLDRVGRGFRLARKLGVRSGRQGNQNRK